MPEINRRMVKRISKPENIGRKIPLALASSSTSTSKLNTDL